jgi:hypothetical protein
VNYKCKNKNNSLRSLFIIKTDKYHNYIYHQESNYSNLDTQKLIVIVIQINTWSEIAENQS